MVDYARHAGAWLFHFSRYFIEQFYGQRGLQVASSLSYTTLLSLVPLITVMFAFPGGLPGFKGLSQLMQDFIFDNFVPAFGNTVQQHLAGFSANASQLTLTGFVFLVVTALILMATIDNALNYIWRVRNQRSPAARFLVYWAMLTLGPILVGAGLVSTSYLLALPLLSDVDASFGLQRRLLSALPFLTTAAAFTLLYVIVPNCYVMRRNAVIGGVVAAVLFEMAKIGFGLYVKSVEAQQIYGAIAVIPLFLIWIYVSWVIVLFGAYITFCLSEFSLGSARAPRDEGQWRFEDAFQLIAALWLAQREGRPLAIEDLREMGIRISQQHVNDIMTLLCSEQWLQMTGESKWVLSRDLDDVTLLDLHRILPRRLPLEGSIQSRNPQLRNLEEVLGEHRGHLESDLRISLGELLRRNS